MQPKPNHASSRSRNNLAMHAPSKVFKAHASHTMPTHATKCMPIEVSGLRVQGLGFLPWALEFSANAAETRPRAVPGAPDQKAVAAVLQAGEVVEEASLRASKNASERCHWPWLAPPPEDEPTPPGRTSHPAVLAIHNYKSTCIYVEVYMYRSMPMCKALPSEARLRCQEHPSPGDPHCRRTKQRPCRGELPEAQLPSPDCLSDVCTARPVICVANLSFQVCPPGGVTCAQLELSGVPS